MKISKTFSLEEDVLESIEKYQKLKNLSSLSSALERIILIELPKRTDLEEIKDILKNITTINSINIDKNINENKYEVKSENDNILDSIENSFHSMND